jgi:hypothetical protein
MCDKDVIGDEFHFLFECTHLDEMRKEFLKPYYLKQPNMFIMEALLTSIKKKQLVSLAKFIQKGGALR